MHKNEDFDGISKLHNWLELEEIWTAYIESEVVSLEIFTNKESHPGDDSQWFWSIYEKDFGDNYTLLEGAGDMMTFCECAICEEQQVEIAEFTSLNQALSWILANKPGYPLYAWVSSALLELATSDAEKFDSQVNATDSCHLKWEAENLKKLLQEVDLKIYTYTHDNKEILPVIF